MQPRLRNSWNVFRRWSFWKKASAISASALSFVLLFVEFTSLANLSFTISIGRLFVLLFCVLGFGIITAWPRKIEESFGASSELSVVRGDILSHTDAEIVVGTSRNFETSPEFVNASSVQGQVLIKHFDSDHLRLKSSIRESLKTKQDLFSTESQVHDTGTVATVKSESGQTFHFLAYTTMSPDGLPCATTDDIWKSLSSLWKCFHGQTHVTLAMPVIGTQNAGLGKVLLLEDSLKIIIMSYALATRSLTHGLPNLRIVVWHSAFENLNRNELKTFVASLKNPF